MTSTRFQDYAVQSRFAYLDTAGFSLSGFQSNTVGPAIFEDRVTYKKELRFLERFNVELRLGGQSEDGKHFIMANRITKPDGEVCCEVRSRAAWFDLRARKLTAPPEALKFAMDALARTDDFETLKPNGTPPP